jgi:hypothetical protein
MKNQRDKLQQYQKKITVITSREHDIAKECLRNGNKQKALLALRRKKYQESLLAKTDQQLAQLEALTSDVEFALVQKDVLYGLQQGTAVLKEIHKEMGGLEKVEMIMGESEEAQAYQQVRLIFEASSVCVSVFLTIIRKSTRCWVVECQIKMKMRLKTSSRLWRGRSLVYRACQMHPIPYRKLYQMFRKRHQKRRPREGGKKERQGSRKQNQSQHDLHCTGWQLSAFSVAY